MKTKAISLIVLTALLGACNNDSEPTYDGTITSVSAYTTDTDTPQDVSKTNLASDCHVLWSVGEEINLFTSRGGVFSSSLFTCSATSNGGQSAVFTGTAPESPRYVALSPYNASATCSSAETVSTNLKTIQNPAAGTFDAEANISIAHSADKDDLHFSNIGAILGVRPTCSGVTSVTFTGTSPLTGAAEIDASETVTVNKGYSAVRMEGEFASGSNYYAVVWPGTHTVFTIALGRSDGKSLICSIPSLTLSSNDNCMVFKKETEESSWETPSQIYINEVLCNASGTPQIELYNPGATAASLKGWILMKDSSELYPFPATASVPAGGYYVVNCKQATESAGATFDISGSDGFDLRLCCGVTVDHVDNKTKVRYIADGHTYGRVHDGSSTWTAFSTGTIGSANTGGVQEPALSKIVLSEINGAASDGIDYIELYNAGTETESLDGFKIRRWRCKDGADDEQTLWKGGESVTLAPGGYLLLEYKGDLEDNKTFPLRLQKNFSAKKNTFIWLQDEEERTLDKFTRGTKNAGWNSINMQKVEDPATGIAYSYSKVSDKWVYALPTPGEANGSKACDIDQNMCPVVINEINLPGNWIELCNMGNEAVDINGLQIRWSRVKDGLADNKTIWSQEESAVLAPGAFKVIGPSDIDAKLYNFTDKNIHIRLRSGSTDDPTGEKIIWDDFKRGTEGTGWTKETLSSAISRSIIRVPDGSGDWYLGDATSGKTNGTDKSGGLCPDVEQ